MIDISGIREIRKRINIENFSNIYGCYVSGGEILSQMNIPVLDLTAEEKDMYLKLFKKCIAGKQDKNLLDIQMPDSDNQKSLYALSKSGLKDENLRNILFEQILNNLETDKNYCILLTAETYDVKSKNVEEDWSEESENQFSYFLCGICPIKETKAELRYASNSQEFRSNSTGNILSAPVLGFMYPAFVDRAADIYSAVYYTSKESHEELIKGVFGVDAPKTADEQKELFNSALSDSLCEDYTLDAAAAVYSNIIAAEENESDFTIEELSEVLFSKNVPDDKISTLQETLGDDFSVNPENIAPKKYEITTGETVITTEPENALRIKTKEIDGHTYILVPATGEIKVNGVTVSTEREPE